MSVLKRVHADGRVVLFHIPRNRHGAAGKAGLTWRERLAPFRRQGVNALSPAASEVVVFTDPCVPIKTYTSHFPCCVANHVHPEIEWLYLLGGTMTVQVADEEILLEAGDIIVLNSFTLHATFSRGPGFAMVLLQFNPDILIHSTLASEYKYAMPFLCQDRFRYRLIRKSESAEYAEVSNLLAGTVEEYQLKRIGYEMFIKSNLYRVLALLYRNQHISTQTQLEPRRAVSMKTDVTKVIDYVEKHFDESIDVAQMSAMLNLNPDYFCRLFKTTTGQSFIQYLNNVRISVAERLLLSTDRLITDILAETGFSSLSYFNRTFKKIKRCSPSEFRKQMRVTFDEAEAGDRPEPRPVRQLPDENAGAAGERRVLAQAAVR